ncbi:hypothetical protein BB559_006303 [Furculomyces boomerangus]|uniref:Phosducin domain-containing protein n=3 Tax=Harpellales TaxID=61421 RepID=A0A2T9Y3N1_9FUNG|nr:hypothetical protein BB559_006775 [Furculomyces boomerangus]PVU86950.1 hypothetical protein BB559_006303 [Furculomyces boomerangus]PWA02765.1 hypothetical protein BB558_001063 [Smittium angustum]
MQDPNEDTEWNDILRKHKIIPEKPKEITVNEIYDLMVEDKRQMEATKHEDMDLDELEEMLMDDRVLEEYRNQRIKELADETQRNQFGEIFEVNKLEYGKHVTETSKSVTVIVHLYEPSKPECKLTTRHLQTLAQRYKNVKFVNIVGDKCIENYPSRNMPTILVYKNGDVFHQLVGIANLGGMSMRVEDLENYLIRTKVLEKINDSDDES